ncbi:MAG: tyrosine-type recombinase/integrase [Planctomycetes bacterium]|nr:tyrosine-type recombinase/integrase [Planctomycetota bacterium]
MVRWRDPVTGRTVQKDCGYLGLTNDDKRRRWALAKLDELREIRARLARGGHLHEHVRIAKSHADYLATFSAVNTIESKRVPLAMLAAWMKERGVKDTQGITPTDLAAFGNHLRRPGSEYAPRSRNLQLTSCAAWLRWAREIGQLPRVMPEEIKTALRTQPVPRDAIDVLAPEQVRTLLRSCLAHDEDHPRERVAPLVLLALLTGCRFEEIRGLQWNEVDDDGKALRLPADRVKTKAARTVTLAECPVALELLGALRMRAAGRASVFRLDRRKAETVRTRLVRDYAAPAWTWHGLRRTCGSVLVCAGLLGPGSTFLAAKRLGHSVTIAERSYLGAMTNLPRDASTIEGALGIEAECKNILRAIGGVPTRSTNEEDHERQKEA